MKNFTKKILIKKIRYIIDYEREDDIKLLKNGIINDCEDKLIEELVDYLNFFEFIASLWKMNQLNTKEIGMYLNIIY